MKCTHIILMMFPFIVFAQSSLKDERDDIEYQVTKLGSLYWMTENLRFKAEGSECLKDCDKIRFYDFQYLDEVCPKGWRLPTMNEWDLFVSSFGDVERTRMMEGNDKLYRVDFFDQFDLFKSNALNIKSYGRMEGGQLVTGFFIDYWTVNPSTNDDRFHMHLSPFSLTGHGHKHHLKSNKPEEYRLFAIRCVCEAANFEKDQ